MNYTISSDQLKLPQVPFVLDLHYFYQGFAQLEDKRKPKGRRYPLALLLLLALLAKLAGQDKLEEIAHWAKVHQAGLVKLLALQYPKMPHATTWSRVFGDKIEVAQFEQLLQQYFAAHFGATIGARGSVILSIDGKTLRGTIETGQTQGMHLMAAYLPQRGVVVRQSAVGAKTNEITEAPKLLKPLDLQGVVVCGDALQTQVELSRQVVAEQQGDYLWFLKDNQQTLSQEIQSLFEALPTDLGPGFSPPKVDFETATLTEKGHGRLEQRTITVSSWFRGYRYWPYLAQVFRLQRQWKMLKTGEEKQEVRYGLTSLPREVADPARLMEIARQEWGIENGLHWVRDVTFREDECQLKRGSGPQVLAALNNLVIGLMREGGVSNLAQGRRSFGYSLSKVLWELAA